MPIGVHTALVVFFMLFWATVSWVILFKTSYLKPKKAFSPLPPMTIWHLLGGFFVFFISFAAITPLLNFFLKISLGIHDGIGKEFVGLAVFCLSFFLYCFAIRKTLFPYFRETGLLIGILSWLLIFPLIYIWAGAVDYFTQHFLGYEPMEQSAVLALKNNQGNSTLFYSLIFMVILPIPAIEEILFRGFLQNWIRLKLGIKPAILITALIFAFFHFSPSQGWSNLTIVSSLFFLGCFLGFLFEKTHSLRTSIGLHSTFNAMSVLFIFIKDA